MIFEFEKFENIVTCDNVAKCKSNPESYNISIYSLNVRSAVKMARGALEEAYVKDKEIHADNIIKIEFNMQQRVKIRELMKFLGINEVRYVNNPKSRARFPKKIALPSGYVDDLNIVAHTSDGFSHCEYIYKSCKEKLRDMKRK
jgi:hypothetical protein